MANRRSKLEDAVNTTALLRPLCGKTLAVSCLCCCLWLAATFCNIAWAQTIAWQPANPANVPYRVLAVVADPRDDSTLYMVTPGGGIWKSTNSGQAWSPQMDSLPSAQVCSVALDAISPDTVYAGSGDPQSPRPAQGVLRSPDGGQTWKMGPRFTNQPVCALGVDPANGARILAGSAEGLFLSIDSGGTWRKVLSSSVTSIAYDVLGNVYAGGVGPDASNAGSVLARSSDGGQTWTNLSLPPPAISLGAQAKWVSVLTRAGTLYVAVAFHSAQFSTTSMDFYRSTDGGVSWSVARSIGEANPPIQLFADASGQNLYLTGVNILTSKDQGGAWNPIVNTTTTTDPNTQVVTTTTTIATATSQFHTGVFTGRWLLLAGEMGLELFSPTQVASVAAISGLPLAQFLGIALDSSGNRWLGGTAGLFGASQAAVTGTPVGTVATMTTGTPRIFAAGNASVYRSINAGSAFVSNAVIPASEPRAPLPPLVVSGGTTATIYVGGQRLYRFAATTTVPVAPGFILFGGIADPGQTVTVTVQTRTYAYTTQAGDTLQSVVNDLTNSLGPDPSVTATADPANFRINLAPKISGQQITFSVSVTGGTLLTAVAQSTATTGVTATASTVDPDFSRVITALAIPPPPASSRTMYASTACLPNVTQSSCPNVSVIWQSTNAGQTWTRRATIVGLVDRLAVDPRQANMLYAAVGAFPGGPSSAAGYSPGDLLFSSDNGVNWTSVRGNLPPVPINDIVIDPTSLPTATNTQPAAPGGMGGGTGPVGAVPGGGPGGGIIIFLPPNQIPQAARLPAQILYVATDAGVFVTYNAGIQWTAINNGLPPSPVTRLALQQPAAILLAATFGRGAYQTSVAGVGPSLIANPISVNVTLTQGMSKSVPLSLGNVSSAPIAWQLTALDSWLTVPAASGVLLPGGSANPTVQVSGAGLSMGTYFGRLQISSGSLVQVIHVTLQVTTAPAYLSIAGGSGATALAGAALPPFVVLATDAAGNPVPGVEVNFAIMAGGGSLSSRSSMTDAAGTASTTLTLPPSSGTVQVSATAGNLVATFVATAVLIIPPRLMANSVVNGVTFNANSPPSVGNIVAIFGEHLASSIGSAVDFPLPVWLENTRVVLSPSDGSEIALPLFFVSPQQINALLPYDLGPGAYSVRVESNTVASNTISLSLAAFSPGIFTTTPNGQQGIFIKEDGSLVTTANPAVPGSVVSLFATGLGAVDPPLDAGAPGASQEPLNRTIQKPRVFFDTYEAEVLYSGLAPGLAGIYQLNIRVPARVSPANNIAVILSIGGASSNRVTVAVR